MVEAVQAREGAPAAVEALTGLVSGRLKQQMQQHKQQQARSAVGGPSLVMVDGREAPRFPGIVQR